MKKKGFTLIELIAVLAIIGLLASIGFLRFSTLDKVRANNEAQNLINDVDYAKMKAMAKGYSYEIHFGTDNYYLVKEGEYKKDAIIIRNLDYISFTNFNTSNDKGNMKFSPAGSVSYPGTITINLDSGVDDSLELALVVKVGDANAKIKRK